jgi:hypothetical protein
MSEISAGGLPQNKSTQMVIEAMADRFGNPERGTGTPLNSDKKRIGKWGTKDEEWRDSLTIQSLCFLFARFGFGGGVWNQKV